jgi:hypothetical protein
MSLTDAEVSLKLNTVPGTTGIQCHTYLINGPIYQRFRSGRIRNTFCLEILFNISYISKAIKQIRQIYKIADGV